MNKTTLFELTTTMVHLAIPPEAGENVSFPLIIWERRAGRYGNDMTFHTTR